MVCTSKSWEHMGMGTNTCCRIPTPVLGPRVVWQAIRAVGIGRPKETVLKMIAWYQTNVSGGRDLCSRPAPYNCSNRMVWTINAYGLMVGVLVGLPLFAHRHEPDKCKII